MRPFGAAVHLRARTVNLKLVMWMVVGSVPAAFLGAYLLHLVGHTSSAQQNVQRALGAALLAGAGAMAVRYGLDRRSGRGRTTALGDVVVRPLPTVAIGVVGGLVVGMTSVGSGSLMIVLLLFLYPTLAAGRLVGTDLTQAVPLTLAAAAGALIFGHVVFSVTASLIIGSVPAVLVGSFVSSTVPDRYVRPVIAFVIFASGLKYVGIPNAALGWVLCGLLLAGGGLWLLAAQPWRTAEGRGRPEPVPQEEHELVSDEV
jgi:uncharacterized membrane protein YfcA